MSESPVDKFFGAARPVVPETPAGFRSGFVSLLGRPNTGKSTLLNALVGTKVAIVADKPQTTRTSIQAVLTVPGEAQVVFLDTPGIHKTDSPLNKRMMDAVRTALDQRDLLLFLADASRRFGVEDRQALDLMRKAETPTILVVNKIDLVPKGEILLLIDQYRELYDFVDYVPVSALKRDGLEVLQKEIVARMPEGPAYFPADHITDQPERFLAGELIREKIVRETREEVPHSVTVMVDSWEELPRLLRIFATVYVERDGQKAIVIGKHGAMMKRVGTLAREEMEALFGRKVFLDLRVKVQPNWREKPAFLDTLDWRTMAGKDES